MCLLSFPPAPDAQDRQRSTQDWCWSEGLQAGSSVGAGLRKTPPPSQDSNRILTVLSLHRKLLVSYPPITPAYLQPRWGRCD